ncbi:hypothetical protein [Thalassotalea atypica]|uniref:hypothetical protein n=1 Tax=Thalassotalea atypica TaxID=2054316 RepID=UPI002573207A|nr:hypothetical protein [Thalassotalea atypica]
MMTHQFKIIEQDWYKRRVPTNKRNRPVSVSIPDYQQVPNHMCQMIVTYDDGFKKELLARVIQNQITKNWTVDAMEVAVQVLPKG